MKTTIVLLSMLFPYCQYAQELSSIFTKGSPSFCELGKTETFCGRDWMNSEQVMDSLKRVIIKLDRKLNSLPQDSTFNDTTSLVLLYSYEYVVRNDPWGNSQQLCIDADKYGTPTTLQKTDKGIKHETITIDNTYVVVTDTYYYLGNSEIWTTHKKYYMRADKFNGE